MDSDGRRDDVVDDQRPTVDIEGRAYQKAQFDFLLQTLANILTMAVKAKFHYAILLANQLASFS